MKTAWPLTLICPILMVGPSLPAYPSSDSPDDEFWSLFATPDQTLDVKVELPDGLLMTDADTLGLYQATLR